MTNSHTHHDNGISFESLLAISFILAIAVYIFASILSGHRNKPWPLYRTAFWILGVLCMASAVVGPLADLAHKNFLAHMLVHLLLGMLSPLLVVFSAPMTLLLRTINVTLARRISSLLKSWPVRMYTDPIVASTLNVGGLWLLYTTNLYSIMHQSMLVYVLIHIHIFFAGYLFAIAFIDIDPKPHKSSFIYRTAVLVLALAAHGILSKNIYANPPGNVPVHQAETGAMLMYYGGDLIDACLIIGLCYQWFKSSRPSSSESNSALNT
ncbi:hypothetical protein CVD28_20300 [Bacillus sp. M6-12]|uniref:cytochrome c oxidase assembly protein n=1 Tax=Bacillus sp. M6-12 TaxID=2054166 RepID=UPI000C792722|nr:cytochrome c oxidase assembly protein [Bacillus sp. M6-12]PLS15846.1 hypothetical protein CVD28_20300 [Bacillus sp. M6-12]